MLNKYITGIIKRIFPDKPIRDILIREGTPTTIFKVFFVLFTFFASIIFVRIMGSTNYGVFSHVSAIIDVLKMPVVFGLPVLVMRETARNRTQQNWGLIKGVWNWASQYIILSSLAIIGLCFILFFIWGNRLDQEYSKSLLWGTILIPFLAYSSLRGGQLKGLHKIVLSQLPEQILFPIIQVMLMCLLGFLLTDEVSASYAMIVYVISGVLVFVIGLWLLARNIPPEIKGAAPLYEIKNWFRSTFYLAGVNGLNIINRQVSIIIAGLLITNSAEIGYYKVAINFSFLAAVGLQIVNSMFEPRFATLFAKNDQEGLQNLATLSARVVLFFNFLITLLLIVFGRFILSLAYGTEFTAAYTPMLILLIGQFINSATGTVSNILNMAGKENLTVKGIAIATSINLILNLALTPILGIVGAAIGTSISLVVMNVNLWATARRELNINSLAINFKQKDH